MNPKNTSKFLKEQGRNAFTLLELLVVIVIIGLLTTIGLPAIRGMTKSNAISAANRQMLDDIAYARQRAISDHTTVYMVFIPPYIVTDTADFPLPTRTADPTGYVSTIMTNLYTGQYTTYALISLRSAGDQPGVSTPRYLTQWRTLPNGIYIATNKFYIVNTPLQLTPPFTNDIAFPFPVATNAPPQTNCYHLPYIAFNYLGQLTRGLNPTTTTIFPPEYIPLARGSIFYSDTGSGPVADVAESHVGDAYYTYNSASSPQAMNNQIFASPPGDPTDVGKPYNQIYIDPLTGRARVQHQDVQ